MGFKFAVLGQIQDSATYFFHKGVKPVIYLACSFELFSVQVMIAKEASLNEPQSHKILWSDLVSVMKTSHISHQNQKEKLGIFHMISS